ncbi:NUDIX hydrolase [bacterium]|nr:NUDIX hydrolase [bacterium]
MKLSYPELIEEDVKNTFELLENYHPKYEEEVIYKRQMLDLLNTSSDCFERSCRVGHFTASTFLLNKAKTHVLLMHHAKVNLWVQLGGHCDGDANVQRVAHKEAMEESGIKEMQLITPEIFDIDIHLFPNLKGEGLHYHFDIRFLYHALDDTFVKNHESHALKWVSIDGEEYPQDNSSLCRVFEKLKALDG